MLYSAYSQKLVGQARSRKEPASHLNIMVVGHAGTGKTSFIRTLCEQLKQDIIQGSLKESKPMALKDTLRATEELYTITMQIEQQGERTALTLIDTPGFSHGPAVEHHVRYIAQYIDYQFERTMVEEHKVRRDAKAVDTHIHACLYFLDTTGTSLSETDRYILRLLSSRVNVIPVMGKADTISMCQLDHLKKAIRHDIFDALQIPIYGYIQMDDEDDASTASKEETTEIEHVLPPQGEAKGSVTVQRIINMLQECITEDDDDEDARAMMAYLACVPFTVIGYEEDAETGRPLDIQRDTRQNQGSDDSNVASKKSVRRHRKADISRGGDGARGNRPILGRVYPWGVLECFNPNHCDLEKLKSTVITTHRDMLRIDTFEKFYERYRTQRLMSRNMHRVTLVEPAKGSVVV